MKVNLKKARNQYYFHMKGAAYRGIEFLLTFEEWLGIWVKSGHYPQRGKCAGQYCMARFGDKGPYAVGNVKIILCSENSREAKLGKAMSEHSKELLSRANTGIIRSLEFKNKVRQKLLGRVPSDEERRKNSEAVAKLRWITDGTKNIRIRPNQVILEGWKLGRTIAWNGPDGFRKKAGA